MPNLSPSDDVSVVAPVGAADALVPRLVVADDGRVIHVAPAFEQLIKGSTRALPGTPLSELIKFCDPRAMTSPVDTSDPTAWAQNIKKGLHAIQLRDCGALVFDFQFDWLSLGTGKKYLLLSLGGGAEEKSAPEQMATTPSVVVPFMPAKPAPVAMARGVIRKVFTAANRYARDRGAQVFLDLSDDVMLRADRHGQIISANTEFFARLGRAPDLSTPIHFIDVIEEDARMDARTIFSALMHDENLSDKVSFEAAMMGKDGPQMMEWRLKRQGEAVCILCRAVGSKQDQAADLLRHQERLSEAEAIAHMGYWRWVVGEEVVTWSDEVYRIFGLGADHFIPTMENINARIARRDLARVSQTFQRALIEQNSYDMEFCIKRLNGEIRYIKCIGRCEKDADDEVIALFGIMQDMTEQNLQAKELREAKEAAERAYAAKSQFLANMSHELRTPLNAIIGFSEMMQRQLLGPIGTPRYLEYIDGIRQSGEHLLDLISDILDMSKIEAGKYALDIEQFNLVKVINLAVHMVSSRARDAHVTLTTDINFPEITLQADRRAVLQMTLNLLSNAIKFTEPGGAVVVRVTHDANNMYLCVKDTGIGIPASMLKTITQPFEQAANHYTRAHDGTGLGLSITKELAELHGGHIDIQSEVGKGTEVTITLPLQVATKSAVTG